MSTHLYAPGRLRITPQVADGLDEHVIPLGYTDAGLATVDLDLDPHVLVSGAPTSGKTAIARGLTAYLLAHGWSAVITGRAVRTTFGSLQGWVNAHVREPEQAEAEDLRTLVRAEVMRRLEIMRAAPAEQRELIQYAPRNYFRPLVVVEDAAAPVSTEGLASYCGGVAVHVVRVAASLSHVENGDQARQFFTTRIIAARPGATIEPQCWAEVFGGERAEPARTGPHVSIAGERIAPRPLEPICCDQVDLECCAHAGARRAVAADGARAMRLADALGTRPGVVLPAPSWLLRGGEV